MWNSSLYNLYKASMAWQQVAARQLQPLKLVLFTIGFWWKEVFQAVEAPNIYMNYPLLGRVDETFSKSVMGMFPKF